MKLRKITALLASAFIAVTAFSAVSFADDPTNNPITFGDIEVTSSSESVFDSGLVMNINPAGTISSPIAQPNAVFTGSDWIINSDTLTSDDAVDMYTFSVTGTRTAVFALETTNTDYVAILCPYDPNTGDITVTGSYVTGGNTAAVGDFNSDGQNNYCAVILNQGSTYGTSYTFALNAKNSGGATSIVNASPDFSSIVCGYSGNVYKINNVNIKTKVLSYINQNVPSIDTDQIYYREYFPNSSASAYHRCYVWVKSSQAYLLTSAMEYGTYVTSNRIYYHAIKIPIIGGTYYCYRRTSVDGTNYDGGTPDGYMVYDLETNTFVDWASGNNFFHTTFYNEAYSFSSAANL